MTAAAPPRLTPRETDVARGVVDGLTSRQIARRLGVSTRTVENHVQRVLHREDLPNRPALVRHVLEHGLLSPTSGTPSPPVVR